MHAFSTKNCYARNKTSRATKQKAIFNFYLIIFWYHTVKTLTSWEELKTLTSWEKLVNNENGQLLNFYKLLRVNSPKMEQVLLFPQNKIIEVCSYSKNV